MAEGKSENRQHVCRLLSHLKQEETFKVHNVLNASCSQEVSRFSFLVCGARCLETVGVI